MSPLEGVAVVTGALSVWLLARNQPIGWWIALVSISAFAVVFARVRLYAEVGIQVVYLVTSAQAIWIWLRGGGGGKERPVTHLPSRVWLWVAPLAVGAFFALRWVLVSVGGAAPFWDALTTVLSLVAHVLLMFRMVESWWIWIAVDVIYVPLYLSRGLALTAALYVGYLVLSIVGLRTFRTLARASRPDPDE